MALAKVSDAQILDAVREHGSLNKAAAALGVARSSLQERVRQGLGSEVDVAVRPTASRRRSLPQITRESLHAALVPPNPCRVKQFLDQLDDESREVVEEALGYSHKDLSAGGVREWLVGLGFKEDAVPGTGAITDHRNGRRPCRCLG